ncbi:MAG: alpha/beta fold hydrolase, partial [Elainellaceae cyanobacterium]
MSDASQFKVWAQHGWADTNREMMVLGKRLVGDEISVIAPDLGYVRTWLWIEPLIQQVEAIATDQLTRYPDQSFRIVGHSMGGLIWLEVLNRHPDWWNRIHSLVLLASPVGGADLGRMIDPFELGIGIAKDLGKNRRAIAETIASHIPTLVVAGDIDGGSDGTIPVESTKVSHASFVCLQALSHPVLRSHPAAVSAIHKFWNQPDIFPSLLPDPILHQLRSVPGMTDGHPRDFNSSKDLIVLKDGRTIRIWKNPFNIHHVFIASSNGHCLYSGFVGWMHT